MGLEGGTPQKSLPTSIAASILAYGVNRLDIIPHMYVFWYSLPYDMPGLE